MCSIAEQRGSPDRAGVREPLLGVDERGAVGLGARRSTRSTIGPSQSIIRRFTSTGHGAAAWTTRLQRRHVVRRPHLLGQLQQPHEHRRHHLGVGDAVPLDRRAGPPRASKRSIITSGAAERVHHAAEPQRRRVVDGRGREVDGVGVEAVERPEDRRRRCSPARRRRGRGSGWRDALGPAGGARGVQQVVAVRLLGQRRRVGRRQRRVVRREPGQVARRTPAASGTSTAAAAWRPGRPCAAETTSALRPAVADDVGGLVRGEVVVDRRDVEPGAQRRPVDLVGLGGVVGEQRDHVPAPQARVVQVVGQPGAALVELGVGERPARAGHHQRGLVGGRRGPGPGVHVPTQPFRRVEFPDLRADR